MNLIELAIAALTLLGAALSLLGRPSVEFGAARSSSKNVLFCFALIVAAFGAFNLYYYRELLFSKLDDVLFIVWLVLSMIGGMFTQVITRNFRTRRRLFDVSMDRLIYPLLFSIVVFYPIWAVASSATHGFFAIHAAFLNGFFWESVVTATKPPANES